jgi:hypothetical protein
MVLIAVNNSKAEIALLQCFLLFLGLLGLHIGQTAPQFDENR